MPTTKEKAFLEDTGFFSQAHLDYAIASINFNKKFNLLGEKCPNCGEPLYSHKGNNLKFCINCNQSIPI